MSYNTERKKYINCRTPPLPHKMLTQHKKEKSIEPSSGHALTLIYAHPRSRPYSLPTNSLTLT